MGHRALQPPVSLQTGRWRSLLNLWGHRSAPTCPGPCAAGPHLQKMLCCRSRSLHCIGHLTGGGTLRGHSAHPPASLPSYNQAKSASLTNAQDKCAPQLLALWVFSSCATPAALGCTLLPSLPGPSCAHTPGASDGQKQSGSPACLCCPAGIVSSQLEGGYPGERL